MRLLVVLFVAHAATTAWPLDDPAEYLYDASQVSIHDGAATMVGSLGGSGVDGDLVLAGATFDLSSDTTGTRTVPDGVA